MTPLSEGDAALRNALEAREVAESALTKARDELDQVLIVRVIDDVWI